MQIAGFVEITIDNENSQLNDGCGIWIKVLVFEHGTPIPFIIQTLTVAVSQGHCVRLHKD